MRIKLIFLVLFSALCVISITAQTNEKKISISGIVLDANKEPIVNAIIMIDGQKTRTITDYEGKYKLRVNASASRIGIFTFGYGIYEESISERTRINFNFETIPYEALHGRSSGIMIGNDRKIASGDEAVEVGYGHIKKKNLAYDIGYIDGTDKKYASYSSVTEMIIRNVSGVRLWRGQIIIQSSANMFGYVSPLIIIDGTFGGSINDIPPSSVKSISVLKGASAAIYGSRGYGGAIIIKTKTYDDY